MNFKNKNKKLSDEYHKETETFVVNRQYNTNISCMFVCLFLLEVVGKDNKDNQHIILTETIGVIF